MSASERCCARLQKLIMNYKSRHRVASDKYIVPEGPQQICVVYLYYFKIRGTESSESEDTPTGEVAY